MNFSEESNGYDTDTYWVNLGSPLPQFPHLHDGTKNSCLPGMEEGVKGVTVVIGEGLDEALDKWQPRYHSSLSASLHVSPCFVVRGGQSRSTLNF